MGRGWLFDPIKFADIDILRRNPLHNDFSKSYTENTPEWFNAPNTILSFRATTRNIILNFVGILWM